ncbi:MAG TPA: hypothetical protein VGD74_13160, partial [Vulgatibacter sp.]
SEALAARGEDGRWQPFFARYDAARTMARIDAAKGGRLQELFRGDHARELPLSGDERDLLRDWDTPEDVAADTRAAMLLA